MFCCHALSQLAFLFAGVRWQGARCGFVVRLIPTTACLVVLCVLAPGALVHARPWHFQTQTPHPAVARVSAPEKGAISFGSGTLVYAEGDYGLVVTNWHVVRDATGEIGVVFPGGFHSPARVAKVDRDWDLAALVVWRPPGVEPVRLANSPPQPGEPLTIAGYGSGDYRSEPGRCTQYVAPGVNMPFEMVEVSAQARQGDSGGPIFNHRGELAGVLFGAGSGTTSGSYCGRVHRFLASVAPSLGRQTLDVSNIAARPVDKPAERNAGAGNAPRFGTPPFVDAPLYEPPSNLAATSRSAAPAVHEPVASLGAPVAVSTPPPFDSGVVAPPSLGARPKAQNAIEIERTAEREAAPAELGSLPQSARPSLAPEADEASPGRQTLQQVDGSSAETASLRDIAGDSIVDQIKTFLALFGVIAFAYHAIRRFGWRAEQEDPQ